MKKIYNSIKNKILLLSLASLTSAGAFAQTDVLVCGAANPQTWLDDVQAKLIATGSFNSVQTYNIYSTGTPTLAYLQTFDAVLVYTDYGAMDPTTFGNNLAAYIDGGGGVVNSVFSTASVLIGGAFNTSTYQVIVPDGSQNSSPTLTYGAVLNGCSPIVQGITSFNGGSSSYRSTSSTLAGGSITANWSNGDWLIAQRENVGPMNARRADLNFYPPSSDVRSDFWDASTQGGEIMANALLWVAGVTNDVTTPATPGAITGTTALCAGITSTYSISAVTGATSYNWTVDGGTAIQSGQGTTSVDLLAGTTTGTISVTALAGTCASAPQTFALTINPLPTVGATSSVSAAVCEGTDVTLSGTGADSYVWSDGITDATAFTATTTTTYTVTGTDANGCVNTGTITVDVNALPAVGYTSSVSAPVCEGTDVTLNGTGADTYVWSDGITDGTPFTTSASLTTFTVTGTDANGCENTATASIDVNALPAVDFTASPSTSICAGQSITLSGTNAVSYTWTGGITDGVSFTPALSGTYDVTGTDANGCENTATASVTVNDLPVVNYTVSPSAVVCMNDNVTLSGTGASTYTWSGGITDATAFTATGSSSFEVTGTDANGCSDTATVNITVNNLPVVTADASDDSVCVNETTVTLNGLPSGGTWSGSTAISGSTFDPSAAGTGNYTLVYSFTDGNGCTATESTPVNVDACLGISENNLLTGLTVYPNPSNGNFNITTNGAELTSLEIIALDGSKVYAAGLNNVSAAAVDASMLANGIYMVRLTGNGMEHTVRISVQK